MSLGIMELRGIVELVLLGTVSPGCREWGVADQGSAGSRISS